LFDPGQPLPVAHLLLEPQQELAALLGENQLLRCQRRPLIPHALELALQLVDLVWLARLGCFTRSGCGCAHCSHPVCLIAPPCPAPWCGCAALQQLPKITRMLAERATRAGQPSALGAWTFSSGQPEERLPPLPCWRAAAALGSMQMRRQQAGGLLPPLLLF